LICPRRYTRRTCCLLLATYVLPGISFAENIVWEQLSEGLAVSVWKPGESCPAVPPLLATDIDPERTRFSVHYYAQEGLSQPPTIEEWQKRTGHHVLFNAGLFRENFAYLGLLYKDGRSLGSRRHTSWQGLFVAEPSTSGLKKAGVLDLASDNFDEQQPPYREAAQALMLLDQTGRIRVRHTGKHAYQTIVAETANGHILLFKSLDLATLYDIGQCLKDTLSVVRQAMAMDGGSSSDVLVSESLWERDRQTRDRASWKVLFGGSTVTHIPLPTVIGISPR
jgi:uncharacterized protein YigE (DUF2233 family)